MQQKNQAIVLDLINHGKYSANKMGIVFGHYRGVKNIKKPFGDRYLSIGLWDGRKRVNVLVHQFIWLYFNGKCDQTKVINHLDGDKKNNHLSNLSVCTSSENQIHAYRTGLRKPKIGEANEQSKLTDKDAYNVRKQSQEGKSSRRIAKELGVSKFCIQRIVNLESYRVEAMPGDEK